MGVERGRRERLVGEAGRAVAEHGVVRSSQYGEREGIGEAVETSSGYPAFVKPANGGSSVGISKVRSRED